MSTHGALATTVADAAALLAVLAEHPELAEVAEPGKLRVAVTTRVPPTALLTRLRRRTSAETRSSTDSGSTVSRSPSTTSCGPSRTGHTPAERPCGW